jgi:hypothetical protein
MNFCRVTHGCGPLRLSAVWHAVDRRSRLRVVSRCRWRVASRKMGLQNANEWKKFYVRQAATQVDQWITGYGVSWLTKTVKLQCSKCANACSHHDNRTYPPQTHRPHQADGCRVCTRARSCPTGCIAALPPAKNEKRYSFLATFPGTLTPARTPAKMVAEPAPHHPTSIRTST